MYVDRIHPNFTLLGKYVNMKTNTLIKCNKCNAEWSPAPTNFLRRIKCKFCENKTIKKPELTPEMLELSGKPCILYVLKLSNRNNINDVCLKVGITNRDLKYRMSTLEHSIGYTYNIEKLKIIIDDEVYIRYLEKYILKKLERYSYNIGRHFGGRTELLDSSCYSSIIKILENHGHDI